ncbi:MAG TPA: thioredoxin domain-containing protein [bacterium]|nr:thioredoxin domain-containing protein [bacterium]
MRNTTKLLSIATLCILALSSCGSSDADIVPIVNKTVSSPTYGMPDAPVKLTIFTDFQCPACIYFHDTVEQQVYDRYVNTGKIRVEYKNFPLTPHRNAERDAAAALCAAEQGRFDAYAARLYAWEKSQNGKATSDDNRIEIARQTDAIDVTQFSTCLLESHYLGQVRSEFREATNTLKLPGTPSFLVDGVLVSIDTPEDILGALEAVTGSLPARDTMPIPVVNTSDTGAVQE